MSTGPSEFALRLRRQDIRLVPAAVTVWAGGFAGLLWGWWAALACGVVAGVAGAAALAVKDSKVFSSAVAVLVCGFLVACPMAVRLFHTEYDPLRVPAAHGAQAVLRVTVAERPSAVSSAGYAGQQAGARSVVIPVDVGQATSGGAAVPTSGRVLLIAPVDPWSRVLPGQDVTASGSLAPAREGELTAAVLYVRGPPEQLGTAPWWQRSAEAMRAGLRQASSGLDEEAAGLLPGLAIGDTSALSPRVDEEFIAAGMSHLTAVSGSNLTIMCGTVLVLLRLFRLGPRFSAAVAGMALVGFLVLVGPDPSVLRAGVMGGAALVAMALGRSGSALSALSLAVAGLVLYDPEMAVSFGFTLSVLATAGLVLLAPRWAAAMVRRGVPPGFAEGLAVPLAAFVVTAPVIAGMAGKLSLVSIVANVLAAPVVAPATVFGVLATAFGFWPWAAHALVSLAGPEADWLIWVARRSARVPGAVVDWPGGWWGGLLAAALAIGMVLVLRHRKLRLVLAIILVVVLLVVVPVRVIAPAWPPAGWAMAACDVGQGDALVLATAEPGRAVVVDTGPEPGPVDDCLHLLGVTRIPLLVVSHLHADHIGGLTSVFDGRSVGAIAVGPGRAPAWAWRQLSDEAARRSIPLLELDSGRQLGWPGLQLTVLGPRYVSAKATDAQDGTEINNSSLVIRADTAAGRVLLSGDVELEAQADLLADHADLRADILKVPHHGSRYSLPQFLEQVSPRIALVSVGQGNPYGHPSKTTLDTLAAAGALVARTDTDGDTAVVPGTPGPSIVRRGDPRGPPR
jgi:competence protein ComEC